VRQSFYSVPVRLARRTVNVRLGAHVLEAVEGGKVVARHVRSLHNGTEDLVLDHCLEILVPKPGGHARFDRSGPSPGQRSVRSQSRTRRLAGSLTFCDGRLALTIFGSAASRYLLSPFCYTPRVAGLVVSPGGSAVRFCLPGATPPPCPESL
jgi:hypothetical protein